MSHIQPRDFISPRTDFGRGDKAYVAGTGRGAVGFTTRSDIGPARQAVVPIDRSISAQKERARQILLQRQLGITPTSASDGAAPMLPATPGALVGSMEGSKQGSTATANATTTISTGEDLSESNYDPFSGYASALFSATGNYDEEDAEADNIFYAIDQRMDSRRKRRREEREREQWEEYHRKRPKVHEFFQKEKRQLTVLSDFDWENLPESSSLTARRRPQEKRRSEKYTPVPDSIIENARRGANSGGAQSVDEMEAKYGGWETRLPVLGTASSVHKGPASGTMSTDLTQLGRARDRHLGIQLDKMADSVTGQTVVDPKGYLTDLTSFHITSDTDVSDIRKARQLLKSVITTNPKHPPGWIAAARLEEAAGKIQAARTMILRGTDACSSSQDIWLEAARLHGIKEARAILARAVRHIPKAIKLWMKASQLEKDFEAKKAVLRRALEIIPNSVALWKAAVELENPNDARIMLSRAVECVPDSVEMWLALARLETYEKAKQVLNKARAHCPTDPSIFVAAAKLEESRHKFDIIATIIEKAIKSLSAHKIVIDREAWLQEAAKCEKAGAPVTCQSIVAQVIGIDVELQDRREHWSQEAKSWQAQGHVELARAIYAHMLSVFPDRWKIWWDAAFLERKHGTPQSCEAILKKAVKQCPTAVKLWLLAAKEKWATQNDTEGARLILKQAFECNPESEEIWLAAVKIESETKNFELARNLLKEARSKCSTPKVWLKSAILERTLRNDEAEKEILDAAIDKFSSYPKLWLMRAQLSERRNELSDARHVCQRAVRSCPHSAELWIEYARIETAAGRISKARSVLENARLRLQKCNQLWLAASELELLHNSNKTRGLEMAKSLLSKGMQQCPESGVLYAFSIEIEPLETRKSKCVLAIKQLKNDANVFTEVARFFWQKRKIKQARDWFERAVTANPDFGDAWAYYYKFTQLYGSGSGSESEKEVIKRCIDANPRKGRHWIRVSKRVGNEDLNSKEILITVAKGMKEI